MKTNSATRTVSSFDGECFEGKTTETVKIDNKKEFIDRKISNGWELTKNQYKMVISKVLGNGKIIEYIL